jgi:hypothetical protein
MKRKWHYADVYGLGVQVGPFKSRAAAVRWIEKEFHSVVITDQLIWKLASPEKHCYFKGECLKPLESVTKKGFEIEFTEELWCNIPARARPWEVTFGDPH